MRWVGVVLGIVAIAAGLLSIVARSRSLRNLKTAEAIREEQSYRLNFVTPLRWLHATRLRALVWGALQIALGVEFLAMAKSQWNG